MTPALYALIGFVFWTIILLFGVAAARTMAVMKGEAQPNEFPAGVPHGSDFYWRLNRAHMNCLENLPLFAAVVLAGSVSNLDSESFHSMARIFVIARVAQSLVHLSSGSSIAINIRFAFFLTQIVCLILMSLQLVM